MDFLFKEMSVGIFMGNRPIKDGTYTYEPYRSLGHYEMHQTLERTGNAKCCYYTKNQVVEFSVVGFPEYGKLELKNFGISKIDNK